MKQLLPLLLLVPMISFGGNADEQKQAYERYVQCRAGCADALEHQVETACFKHNDVKKHEECFDTARAENEQCSAKCKTLLPK